MAVRIKLNSAGIRKLLRSDDVRHDLERRAEAIAAAAGKGMEADSQTGTNRASATVWTDTPGAMSAEARSRALTRAIDAGRG